MSKSYLNSVTKQFEYYKNLGDNTFDQLDEDHFFWESHPEGNSVAIIVKHMVGNMMSRWTNFFIEDGEKPWRDRDDEFVNSFSSKQEVIDAWKKGWDCLFDAISVLKDKDLESVLYIRNQGHTITEAINRQLCHYAYHIGQIVFIGRTLKKEQWVSLSIPKGQSNFYNKEKFEKDKERKHFTDDL